MKTQIKEKLKPQKEIFFNENSILTLPEEISFSFFALWISFFFSHSFIHFLNVRTTNA